MRATIILAITVLLSPALRADEPTTTAKDAIAKDIVWHNKYDAAYREMQSKNRPMLVFIKSNDCLFCERMEAKTYSNPKVIQEVAEQFIPAVVNSANDPTLARQLGVRVYPTTVIISAEGKIVDAIPGYLAAEAFRARLETARRR